MTINITKGSGNNANMILRCTRKLVIVVIIKCVIYIDIHTYIHTVNPKDVKEM